MRLRWPLEWARRMLLHVVYDNSPVMVREPDFVVGPKDDPYMRRWYLIPRNSFFNIYLHQFHHSDEDRALHDHPYANVSWIVAGGYWEDTILAGGVHKKTRYEAGSLNFRRASAPHRIEIDEIDAFWTWTIFITGPRVREWGFHCSQGWRHWKDFVSRDDKGSVGRGCGD